MWLLKESRFPVVDIVVCQLEIELKWRTKNKRDYPDTMFVVLDCWRSLLREVEQIQLEYFKFDFTIAPDRSCIRFRNVNIVPFFVSQEGIDTLPHCSTIMFYSKGAFRGL